MIDKEHAPAIARIALALVFLWFGFTQVFTDLLIGYVPAWTAAIASPQAVMLTIGIFEIVFGGLLLIGLFTRVSAALLSIYLLVLIFSLGYNEIAVRDLGLLLVLVSVFLNGPDKLSLDFRMKKK